MATTGKILDPQHWIRQACCARREDIIDQYVAQGDVLDLGVVDSRRGKQSTVSRLERFGSGLHEHIRRRNRGVLGVDIDREGVELLNARGYNMVCADVETMALGRTFDTIVAGEIIEHLGNPVASLRNLRRHLKPQGHLLLSTCNPFYSRQQWKIWRYGNVQVHDEHTAWFDPHTLARTLSLAGYRVTRLAWLREKRRGWGRLRQWPALLRPYFSPNFLIVATPDASQPAKLAAAS